MKCFLVLCLVGISLAAPQYSYNVGGGGGFGGIGSGSIGSGSIGSGSIGSGSIGSGGYSGIGGGGIGGGGGNIGGGNIGGGNIGGGGGFGSGGFGSIGSLGSFQAAPSFASAARIPSHHHRAQQLAPTPPVVTKHFYIHSAPEDTEDEVQDDLQQLRQQSRKHFNVVFIKAPTTQARRTAITLAQALNEEKTVIYVLSKKPDAAEIRTHLQQQNFEPKKPEVFFIKYKTPEEAQYAQQQIQAQYDSLGGATQISDEGVAPISSVIGSLGDSGFIGGGNLASGSSISGGAQQIGGGDIGNAVGQSVQNTYLPVRHK